MTVEIIKKSRNGLHFYSGLSSDQKPLATSVPSGSTFWEIDTGEVYRAASGLWHRFFEPSRPIVGARQPGVTNGADHVSVATEGKVQKVAFGDGDTTLWNGPALLFGFRVTTALSAHAWSIDDDATAKIDLPASLAAGVYPLPCAAIFETSLKVNVGASASAGVVEFYFRPSDSGVSWA